MPFNSPSQQHYPKIETLFFRFISDFCLTMQLYISIPVKPYLSILFTFYTALRLIFSKKCLLRILNCGTWKMTYHISHDQHRKHGRNASTVMPVSYYTVFILILNEIIYCFFWVPNYAVEPLVQSAWCIALCCIHGKCIISSGKTDPHFYGGTQANSRVLSELQFFTFFFRSLTRRPIGKVINLEPYRDAKTIDTRYAQWNISLSEMVNRK